MASKRKSAANASRRTSRLPEVEIGILGGTGLYDFKGLEDLREVRIKTPFGDPSDAYIIGRLEGRRVAFLSRHGRGHRHLPTEVNFRANICGFKLLGAERVVSVNSCGSLREDIRPRDIVFADQFFDRARRPSTFFGRGVTAHVGLAHPVCGDLAGTLFEAGRALGLPVHPRGTYLNMEGPAFSTKAESRIYRSWGCDIIGMTSATEARLAREAEICYATMNLVTDYDVWHEEEGPVSVEMILENLKANVHNALAVIRAALPRIGPQGGTGCGCGAALKNCIVTDRRFMPAATRRMLMPLIGKYIKD